MKIQKLKKKSKNWILEMQSGIDIRKIIRVVLRIKNKLNKFTDSQENQLPEQLTSN